MELGELRGDRQRGLLVLLIPLRQRLAVHELSHERVIRADVDLGTQPCSSYRLVDDAAAGRRAPGLGHSAVNFYDDRFLVRVDPVDRVAKAAVQLVVARGAIDAAQFEQRFDLVDRCQTRGQTRGQGQEAAQEADRALAAAQEAVQRRVRYQQQRLARGQRACSV